MAVYDFKDQEEIENFKYFWKKSGRWIFALMLAAAAAYLAWTLYQGHQETRRSETVALYDEWARQHETAQHGKAAEILARLQSGHSAEVLTAQATMLQAAHAFGQKNYAEAEGHYRWVLEYQQHPMMRALAVQRLAVVQLQQQQYDAALATLQQPVDSGFEALLLETRGDVYAAQGKRTEAGEAYRQALEKLPENAAAYQILKWKADGIL